MPDLAAGETTPEQCLQGRYARGSSVDAGQKRRCDTLLLALLLALLLTLLLALLLHDPSGGLCARSHSH